LALPHQLRLTSQGLARITRKYGIGEPHITLAPEAVWLDHDEEFEAARAAEEEFDRLGLIGPRGLDAELVDSLTVLVRARTEYYGWFGVGRATYAVLAAATGREALLAVREEDTISLHQLRQHELAEALVDQLPNTPAVRFPSISLPLAEVRRVLARSTANVGAGHRASSAPNAAPEIRQLHDLMGLPVTGSGQLYAAVRDDVGRRARAEYPVRVVDTTLGRLQNVTIRRSGGEHWVVVAPASRTALVERLGELRRELAD
jgi:EspG family